MCFRSLYTASILWNYIQYSLGSICLYNHNYALVVGKVGCLIYLEKCIVDYLGGSVLKVDIAGSVKKRRATSGFGLKVILGESLFVSGPCTLMISCVNISNID